MPPKRKIIGAAATTVGSARRLAKYVFLPNYIAIQLQMTRLQARLSARDVLRQWGADWEILVALLDLDESDPGRTELRRRYRECSRDNARDRMREEIRENAIFGAFVTALLAAVFSVGIPFASHSDALLVVLLVGLLGLLTNTIILSLSSALVGPRAAVFATLALGVVSTSAGYLLLPPGALVGWDALGEALAAFEHLPAAALLLVGITSILLVGETVGLTACLSTVRRRSSDPRSNVVYELLQIVECFEATDAVDHAARRFILARLREAARIIRVDFPRSIRLPDAKQRALFKDRCHRAAYSLDTLQFWVAAQKFDTGDRMVQAIASTIHVLLVGAYDELPNPELPVGAAGRRFREVGRVVRAAVSGALPVVVLLGLRSADVRVGGALESVVATCCFVWASITFLSILDPQLHQRISMIKDLIAKVRAGNDQK